MAAQSLGYRVVVLDPGEDGPAGSVADRHVRTDYLDPAGLAELAALAGAATTEFENVPARALAFLARTARVCPAAASVAIAQDRIREKAFLADHGFGVAPYAVLASEDDARGLTRRCCPGSSRARAWATTARARSASRRATRSRPRGGDGRECPASSSSCVPLAREVSVVVARREHGETATWPVAENHHRDGILDVSIVPARVPAALAARAREVATAVAAKLDYRGVLCVEMFVTTTARLLVNEIAPRPHNSGHYTIDACVTSQFEQQARVLAGLPLGGPAAARARGDGEPAGRHLVHGCRRRSARARLDARARPSRGEAAPLRQGGTEARPQDGTRHLPRADARRCAGHGARHQARSRHPGRRTCFERRTPTSAPETRPMRLRSRASACWI